MIHNTYSPLDKKHSWKINDNKVSIPLNNIKLIGGIALLFINDHLAMRRTERS
jgi:hypothetical protein